MSAATSTDNRAPGRDARIGGAQERSGPRADAQNPEAKKPLLGNTGEFAAIPSGTQENQADSEAASRRVLRYVLQSAARELLGTSSGVYHCLRSIKGRTGGVEVYHSPAHGSAHYGNLRICGLNWVCPVCVVKIASRRVVEVEQAAQIVQEYQGVVCFMTLTIPHYFGQAVAPLARGFLAAVRSFKSSRWYREIMRNLEHLGEIRSLEVTHGANGWHPHTHSLHFFPGSLGRVKPLRDELAALWASTIARRALGSSHEVHGLDFIPVSGETACAISGYMVKTGEDVEPSRWGSSDELVRGNSKQARRGGRTPFALLADYALLEDAEAGQLFKAYAAGFKGKNHLRWSKGLRGQLGLSWVELSDQEVAEEQTEEADLLGVLSREDWRVVLCAGRAARGELLEIAVRSGWGGVVSFVHSLR